MPGRGPGEAQLGQALPKFPAQPGGHAARRPTAPGPARGSAARGVADAALRLGELRFATLAAKDGELEAAYGAEAPFGVVCAVRPRSLAATAAVMVTTVAATLLALHAAVTVSLGLSLVILLIGGSGGALLAARWPELKAMAASRNRAAVARAATELDAEAAEAIWRAAVAWATAPASVPGRVRSFAQRGARSVLVEARPSALVAAPLEALVLEPLGDEGEDGLRVSSYVVPTSRGPAAEVAAAAAAGLRELLGLAEPSTPGSCAEAAAEGGSACEQPLAKAASLSQLLSASRELRRLEASGGDPDVVLGRASAEQLRVVGGCCEESVDLLARRPRELMAYEYDAELGLEWGCSVDKESGSAAIVWEQDMPHADVLKVVAALLERDLRAGTTLDPDLLSAKELSGESTPGGIWRTISRRVNGDREDTISHAMCFDGLSEPQGAVYCVVCPAYKQEGEYCGMQLPPVLDRHTRPAAGDFLWAAMLVPRVVAGDRRRGLRLRGALRLGGVWGPLLTLCSALPGPLLRQALRHKARQLAPGAPLLDLIERRGPELERRIAASPRAELYERLRQHLAGLPSLPR